MKNILTSDRTSGILSQLSGANQSFESDYPGKSLLRQPVHTIYGGAHLFKTDTAQKMGKLAIKNLNDFAPNFVTFAHALELKGAESLPKKVSEINDLVADAEKNGVDPANSATWLAWRVYGQVCKKMKREAVEDFRLDYEDGFGIRPDEEEDAVAVQGAKAVAAGMKQGTLPPFIGIRIKPFNSEFVERGVRTLNIFISTLLAETGGVLPDNFVVTLPKVEIPEQAAALVQLFEVLEADSELSSGDLKMEIMIETTQSVFNSNGEVTARKIVKAAKGRCIGAHFGTYDYTASCDLIAAYQTMDSAVCDFARDVMKVAFGGSGIFLSDGATNIMPVGPHRPSDGNSLTDRQIKENKSVVHHAWRLNFNNVNHSLKHGYYQGWDLHPSHLPLRYAAVYSFFLDGLASTSLRLKSFMGKAAQATLIGDVFDDAATGQALLNYFLQGISCGAILEKDAEKTGLTLDEIRTRSFKKILQGRQS